MSNPDQAYLIARLTEMLALPSPSLYTGMLADWLRVELERLDLAVQCTARGDLIAECPATQGPSVASARALTAHMDTLGAMVVRLKRNGRLAVRPIGTWSARFADGARVRVHGEPGDMHGVAEGTLLPTKASGHVFSAGVDAQRVDWAHIELRLDLQDTTPAALAAAGIRVGALVSVDSAARVTDTGFIHARHLDNKAAIACVLAALETGARPRGVRLVFSCAEELGIGMNRPMLTGIEEILNLDIAAQGKGQNGCQHGVTIAMMDAVGPLHPLATRRLIRLCERHAIPFTRDCFRYYDCDGDAASRAGFDVRNALACFGADASHGWERVHVESLLALSRLVAAWFEEEDVDPHTAT